METTAYKATDLYPGDRIPRPDGDLTITEVERLDDGRVLYRCGDRADTMDPDAWVHIIAVERPPAPPPEEPPAADEPAEQPEQE